MPQAAAKVAGFFGLALGPSFDWKNIGKAEGIAPGAEIKSEVLFAKLEDELVDTLRERYSGSQQDRQAAEGSKETKVEDNATPKPAALFEETVDLRVAKIEKIERHPKADKLYVINLETGEGVGGVREERTIVSGLVPFYTEEQLLGKRIIVAYNLKPAKLRGIESRGMLLAAGDKGGSGPDGAPVERVEVLDAGDIPTGTRLLPEGVSNAPVAPVEIDIDTFFSYPLAVKDFVAQQGGRALCLDGKPVRTTVIPEGEVH